MFKSTVSLLNTVELEIYTLLAFVGTAAYCCLLKSKSTFYESNNANMPSHKKNKVGSIVRKLPSD